MSVNAPQPELDLLILRHLKAQGFHAAAEELQRRSPQAETNPSPSLLDIYKSWLKASKKKKKAKKPKQSKTSTKAKRATPNKKTEKKVKSASPQKKPVAEKRKKRTSAEAAKAKKSKLQARGDAAQVESDSDSSLDVEKWKKLLAQMSEADIAKMDTINSLASSKPQDEKKRVRKPRAKPPPRAPVSQSQTAPERQNVLQEKESTKESVAKRKKKTQASSSAAEELNLKSGEEIQSPEAQTRDSETPVSSMKNTTEETASEPKKKKRKKKEKDHSLDSNADSAGPRKENNKVTVDEIDQEGRRKETNSRTNEEMTEKDVPDSPAQVKKAKKKKKERSEHEGEGESKQAAEETREDPEKISTNITEDIKEAETGQNHLPTKAKKRKKKALTSSEQLTGELDEVSEEKELLEHKIKDKKAKRPKHDSADCVESPVEIIQKKKKKKGMDPEEVCLRNTKDSTDAFAKQADSKSAAEDSKRTESPESNGTGRQNCADGSETTSPPKKKKKKKSKVESDEFQQAAEVSVEQTVPENPHKKKKKSKNMET